MNTTGPVMTVTDELLAELELFESGDCCVPAKALLAVTAELRRLRAENAELAKDAGRYRWLRDSIWYVGPDDFYCGEGGDMNEYQNHNFNAETLDAAIDIAMATK